MDILAFIINFPAVYYYEMTDQSFFSRILKSCRFRKWIQHSKLVGGAIWYGKVDLEENKKLAKKMVSNIKCL